MPLINIDELVILEVKLKVSDASIPDTSHAAIFR